MESKKAVEESAKNIPRAGAKRNRWADFWKKRSQAATILVVGVAVVAIVLIVVLVNVLRAGDALVYKISYFDDAIPGSTYDINLYNNRITMQRTQNCSAEDCEPTVSEVQTLAYDEASIKQAINFVRNNFTANSDGVIDLSQDKLTARQRDVVNGLLAGQNAFEIAIKSYKGRIEYSPNWQETYYIYLKDDGSVMVKKSTVDDNFNIADVETYTLQFPEAEMAKFKEFMERVFADTGNDTYYHSATLRKDEKPFYLSVVENNSEYLADEISPLAYAVNYYGVNCITPTLYIYEDGTYEIFNRYSTDTGEMLADEGQSTASLADVLVDIPADVAVDAATAFLINRIQDGAYYTVADDNAALNGWLNGLGVDLRACLEL